jgi:hypothetical protein
LPNDGGLLLPLLSPTPLELYSHLCFNADRWHPPGKLKKEHKSRSTFLILVYRTLDIPSDYCISTEKFYTANAALNVVSDILILLLPIPIVWGLNTDKRKKVILTGLFSMGLISCLVSILRMRSIIVLYKSGFNDLTWGLVEVVLWTQAELTAAMICTCTPCLRPLFEKVIPALRSVGSRKGTHGSGTAGYLRTDDYESKSTGTNKSKSFATDDVEMDAGIHKKVTYDVRAMGSDDSDSQKSIIHQQGY